MNAISRADIKKANKKIAYGCVPVNVRKNVSVHRLSQEVLYAIETLGKDSVWGITPNCGLRLVENDTISRRQRVAFEKMKLLSKTARAIEKSFGD